jgi:hypothetical protein
VVRPETPGIKFGPDLVKIGCTLVGIIQVNKVDGFTCPSIGINYNVRFLEIRTRHTQKNS